MEFRLRRTIWFPLGMILVLFASAWLPAGVSSAAPVGLPAVSRAVALAAEGDGDLVPDDQPPDYDIPYGHFFSQAVPAAPRGHGFSVSDAGGVPLWREYQRLGGLEKLGYPVSRRFILEGRVAQAFQGGVLRWRAEKGRAEILASAEVPDEAVEPEPPARLGQTAKRLPWSGWWWPASAQVAGPRLIDPDGPLAKYDRFVVNSGGDDPQTLAWERQELWFAGFPWAGHCNGWAAAALLEEEPTAPREVGGIQFGVADLKGLLTAYHFADAAAWLYGGPGGLSPLDFHRQLLEWLGRKRRGMVLTFRPSQDDEVWSYPAYRFELVMGTDPLDPQVTHVQARVWLADNNVPADFVGLQLWRGEPQRYAYRLIGPREAPTGAEWEGGSEEGGLARPSEIWYPDPKHRNVDRVVASPDLDYSVIKRIVRK